MKKIILLGNPLIGHSLETARNIATKLVNPPLPRNELIKIPTHQEANFAEYQLILKKESKLSASKRAKIVRMFE